MQQLNFEPLTSPFLHPPPTPLHPHLLPHCSSYPEYSTLKVTRPSENVLEVQLNRPERSNAMNKGTRPAVVSPVQAQPWGVGAGAHAPSREAASPHGAVTLCSSANGVRTYVHITRTVPCVSHTYALGVLACLIAGSHSLLERNPRVLPARGRRQRHPGCAAVWRGQELYRR
jgi:hypothetical protein